MPDRDYRPKILAVDDEAFNLDILGELLEDAGYQPILAVNGEEALGLLELHSDVEVIVLDRMMPVMDGMACLERLKSDGRYMEIPVIMQTAAASHEQVRQGIEAGVFYYLTKPYKEDVLLSLVRQAMTDARVKMSLRAEVRQHKHILGLMRQSQFHFRTLSEARDLAVFIANCFPEPERVVYGLSELMVNAVEHGNLGISYEDKTRLVLAGTWQQEVERRLALPEQASRFAELRFEATGQGVTVSIRDQGAGFDFNAYLDLSPERATDPHGRGIATARMMSFDDISYSGGGSEVKCTVRPPGKVLH